MKRKIGAPGTTADMAAAYQRATGSGVKSFEDIQAEEQARRNASAATPEDNAPDMVDTAAYAGLQGLTLGYSDEILAGLESIGSKKKYREIRDEYRDYGKSAQAANPVTYGVADILGSLAPAALTAGATEAVTGARIASTAAKAAIQGGVEGAVSGAGYSEEEGVGGILADAAKGAAIGAGTGALTGHLADRAIEGAEKRSLVQFTKGATEGADPTFRKRFLGQSDKFAKGDPGEYAASAQQIFEKDTEMSKLLRGNHAKDPEVASEIVDHAKSKLNELTSETAPLYKKLDREVGEVPLSDVTEWLDGAIDKQRKTHGGEAIADVLQEVRGDFVKVRLRNAPNGAELAKALENPETAEAAAREISQLSVPHQEVRKWVSELLDHKTRVMGSLAETERFQLANDAHRVADNFLKSHLDSLAAPNTGLAPDVARLRELNKEIAVYVNAKQLFEHKATKSLMRQVSSAADDRTSGLAAIVGYMSAGPAGAAQALGLRYGVPAAARGVRSIDRAATAALAKVVRAAREGDPTAQLVQKAIQAGVPATAVSAALGAYRGMSASE